MCFVLYGPRGSINLFMSLFPDTVSLFGRKTHNTSLVDLVALATQVTTCLEAATHVNITFHEILRPQSETINGADLPPVQVALSYSPTNFHELYDLAVYLLAIGWKIG